MNEAPNTTKEIKDEQKEQRDILAQIKTKLFNGLFAKVDRIDEDAKKRDARRNILTAVGGAAFLAFVADMILHFISRSQ